MKNYLICILLLSMSSCHLFKKIPMQKIKTSRNSNYELPKYNIDKIPNDYQEFQKMYTDKNSPQRTISIILLGMWIYSENKELGEKIIATVSSSQKLNEPNELKNTERYRLAGMRGRYVVQSYFRGTNTSNMYGTNLPFVIESFTKNSNFSNAESLKVYVLCNGADNPRVVSLVQENNIWKAKNWIVLTSNVKRN